MGEVLPHTRTGKVRGAKHLQLLQTLLLLLLYLFYLYLHLSSERHPPNIIILLHMVAPKVDV